MKRLSRKVCLMLLSLVLICSNLFSKDGQFTIMSMNDTHSQLFAWEDSSKLSQYGGAARWKTIIDNVRSEVDSVLVLHGGDFITGSDSNYLINHIPDWDRLPTYGYRGLIDIPLLDLLDVDAVCLGNHEFDFGLSWLFKVLAPARFQILSSNLELVPVPKTIEFTEAANIHSYALFQRGGLSIAVIGLTTDEFIKSSQVRICNPEQTVRTVLEEIGDMADVIVVLSHLGYERDVELAKAVGDIDIIIGGHSHTTLYQPVFIGDTVITQTGAYGKYLGRLDVSVQDSTIGDVAYSLVPNDFTVPEDPEIVKFLADSLAIGIIDKTYTSDNTGNSTMGELVSEMILKDTKADIAISMGSLAEGILPEGEITPQRFFDVFWPYRIRSYGPEKDMTPGQVLDIIQGVAPRITRTLLGNAEGVANLVHLEVPSEMLPLIQEFNLKLSGSSQFMQISEYKKRNLPPMVSVVMDFQSYRLLLERKILDKSVPIHVEDRELFELMFQAFQ